MVEVLLDRVDGQEVAVVESNCIPEPPAECTPTERTSAEKPINEKLSPIQEFYYGQSIFITGGTGFMGKLLIEKILRTCPGVVSIYLLVRPKKGKDVHQRTEEIFDDPLFVKLKDEQPKFRHQIVAVAGDCSQPSLGMSSQDRATIIREVSIVFHVAATVRFDEKLKLAVPINVRSTRDILNLCKEIANLKVCLNILPNNFKSTCEMHLSYLSNYFTKRLHIYCRNLPPQRSNIANSLRNVSAALLWDCRNVKMSAFRNIATKLISTYREPLRGWIDNMYGPTGVAAGAGTGLLRSIHCDGSVHANVVPADLTVNALIATAWDVADIRRVNNKSHGDIPIYNYVSKDNPITYDELKEMSSKYGLDIPSTRAVWYYSFRNNKHRIVHLFFVYFWHLFPALLVDTATVCMGKQPRLLKVYKKIHKFMDVLNYFATQEWMFTNDRLHALLAKLTFKDRQHFYCDVRDVDWNVYFETYILGIRLYLIKDPLDTLHQARVKWQRLYWCHQALKIILAYIAIKLSWSTISTLFSFFSLEL
ncbi:Putative fatty acyl-CoA reductase [Ooceraea biroi]|uniref:Fatty acyl-CoA reductase n=1 Tax=Ooceraea biroi TaxID=2015173 RepID=A0A026WQG0_OOCBI|nr:Putative fatty acyl-CoA reductase [Ooceraea biroi]